MKKLLILIPLSILLLGGIAYGQTTQCYQLASAGQYVWTPCSIVVVPNYKQAIVSTKSTGSVASLNAAYGSNTTAGGTLEVSFCNGNHNEPTAPITDTLTLTWFKAVQTDNGTIECGIWYAVNTAGGADTVTVTPGGSNASIAMTIREMSGIAYPVINSNPVGPQAIDQAVSGIPASGLVSPVMSFAVQYAPEIVIADYGLGTGAQTITIAGTSYHNDSGQQNPTTPAGLFSFVSSSLSPKSGLEVTNPSASIGSGEPWVDVAASFRVYAMPIVGTVNLTNVGNSPVSLFAQLAFNQPLTATFTTIGTRPPSMSLVGDLYLSGANVAGSPSGCTITVSTSVSQPGSQVSATLFTWNVTPGNSLQSIAVTPTASASMLGDLIITTYACGTYPTAGLGSISFDPTMAVSGLGIAGTPAGGVVSVQGVASGTNIPVTVSGGNLTGNQSINIAQVAGSNVAAGAPLFVSPGTAAIFEVSPTTAANTTGNPFFHQGTLSHNGAAAGGNRIGALAGIVQTSPNNGTAATQGRDSGLNTGTDGTLWASLLPGLRPASYHASSNFAASSTTDNACMYGNGTDTVLLYEVDLSGVQTTAGMINVQLIRRSAAETGGTSANFTVVKDDTSNYAAASSTPVSYTGTGPTPGTAVGNIDNRYTGFLATTTASPADLYLWNGQLKPQLLIGTTQGICINLGGAVTGGQVSVTWYWEEIANIAE